MKEAVYKDLSKKEKQKILKRWKKKLAYQKASYEKKIYNIRYAYSKETKYLEELEKENSLIKKRIEEYEEIICEFGKAIAKDLNKKLEENKNIKEFYVSRWEFNSLKIFWGYHKQDITERLDSFAYLYFKDIPVFIK